MASRQYLGKYTEESVHDSGDDALYARWKLLMRNVPSLPPGDHLDMDKERWPTQWKEWASELAALYGMKGATVSPPSE